MPRLSLWNSRKQNDYKFFDKTISEQFRIGGTAFLIHKYLGPHDEEVSDDKTQQNFPDRIETNIQDVLWLENRDRKYDKSIYELRGVYSVPDNDFDLTQFGLFLSNDTLYVEFHLNDMIAMIGRKLMSGDVMELPHLRDDTLLSSDPDDELGPVIPKLYKIEDGNRSSSGFSPTWWPHIWRVKISPLTDSQEFRDIIGDGDDEMDLKNFISTFGKEIEISDAIVAEAECQVPNRNLEHAHLYVRDDCDFPNFYMTDGIPPNGAKLVGRGDQFPAEPCDGDWFLRNDFNPAILYQRDSGRWIRKEADWREKWTTADRILDSFISNRNKIVTKEGEEVDSRQALRDVAKPRTRKLDPDIGPSDCE